jgi:hypothetical protein
MQPLCMRPNGKGKTGYRSRAKANQARINQQATADVRLYTYRCPRCGLFHITSQPEGTPVELIDGRYVVIAKPRDEVERDIETARQGDWTHIRWAGRKPIPVRLIVGVIPDTEAA